MTAIGFIGLGTMGAPMAANLVNAGHDVTGFDIAAGPVAALAAAGGRAADTAAEAVAAAEVVITMLPAGPQVRAVSTSIVEQSISSAPLRAHPRTPKWPR